MSQHVLFVRVSLYEPRYHGQPEWPPAPARLFQALVAAAGPQLDRPEVQAALRWLEALAPPQIGAPASRLGREVPFFVPNNDLDAVGGDPARVAEIRAGKRWRPRHLAEVPFCYAWTFEGDLVHADTIVRVAADLYQFGRGVDLAWARAEVLDLADIEQHWSRYSGVVHTPSGGTGENTLACPVVGTFDSLARRFAAQAHRVSVEGAGRSATRVFTQPPKAALRHVAYDAPPVRFVFEIRSQQEPARFATVPLADAHEWIVAVRDAAVDRLVRAIGRDQDVAAALVGRRPGEPERVPTELRVRLWPLPSMGHAETDPGIRRLVLEVPRGGPIPAGDLRWALSGLQVGGAVLVPAADDAMLQRYLRPSAEWRSMTPVALPTARRRIEPDRRTEEAKGAPERAEEERAAIGAVHQALRHAGVRAQVAAVQVRREPALPKGERAEAFACPPRFPKERLWHVALTLHQPVAGPILVGDGRFLGLGLFAPAPDERSAFAYHIRDGLSSCASPRDLAVALRRATLARAQEQWGRTPLPPWVSGHERDGSPARDHRHLRYVVDLVQQRLIVLLPPDRRDPRLTEALTGLAELRAGRAGRLTLAPASLGPSDPLVAAARQWRTLTPYQVRRHVDAGSAAAAVEADLRSACFAAGLPDPETVVVRGARTEPGVGLLADLELTFAAAVPGPILLGRSCHKGGGVFVGLTRPSAEGP